MALAQYVADQDVPAAANLLSKQSSIIDLHPPARQPHLIAATLNRHADMVKLLLNYGAHVDMPSIPSSPEEPQCTALQIAADRGSAEIVRALIRAKASLNATDLQGRSALMLAALNDHCECVKALLEPRRPSGKLAAKIRHCDYLGKSALHYAAIGGSAAVVALLLEHEMDLVAAEQNNNYTPLHSVADHNGATPLHIILIPGKRDSWNKDVAKLLLVNGADIHTEDSAGRTPQSLALSSKHMRSFLDSVTEALKLLSEKYAASKGEEKHPPLRRGSALLFLTLLQPEHVRQDVAVLPLVTDAVKEVLRSHKVSSIFIVECLFLVTLIFLFIRTAWIIQKPSPLGRSEYEVIGALALATVVAIMRFFVTGALMHRVGLIDYWRKDVWNMSVDLWSIGFCAAIIAGSLSSGERFSNRFRITAGIGSLPMWLALLGYLRSVNARFATFITVLSKVMDNLKSFLVVLCIVMLAFTTAFFLVLRPRSFEDFDKSAFDDDVPDVPEDDDEIEPFGNVPESLLTVFGMLIGNFERSWFYARPDDASDKVAIVLFVLFFVVVHISLLNVLIAVVSDSYDHAMSRSQKLYHGARLSLFVKMSLIFDVITSRDAGMDDGDDGLLFTSIFKSRYVQCFFDCCPGQDTCLKSFWMTAIYFPLAVILLPVLLLDLVTVMFKFMYNANDADSDNPEQSGEAPQWHGRNNDIEVRMRNVVEPLKSDIADMQKAITVVLADMKESFAAVQRRLDELEQDMSSRVLERALPSPTPSVQPAFEEKSSEPYP